MRILVCFIVALAVLGCREVEDSNEVDATQARLRNNADWQQRAGEHPLEDAWPPTEFTASIGGFAGASYELNLNADGNLVYLYSPDGFFGLDKSPEEIPVTEDMSDEFSRKMNAAKVWAWRRRYDDPSIADGTVWKLRIKNSEQEIVSSGSNAYPNQDQFNLFLEAVSNLADGRRFE